MPHESSVSYHQHLIKKVKFWGIVMSYKCAACSKQDLECIKSLNSISCLLCLKKSHPCDIMLFSELKFSKFKKERVKLHLEKKLAWQQMSEVMMKIDHLKKQKNFLNCWEAEALHQGFNNITELKRAKAQELMKKQSVIKSTNNSLSALNSSFFEMLLPEVMSPLDFLDETFEEVPDNLWGSF